MCSACQPGGGPGRHHPGIGHGDALALGDLADHPPPLRQLDTGGEGGHQCVVVAATEDEAELAFRINAQATADVKPDANTPGVDLTDNGEATAVVVEGGRPRWAPPA